jgi:DNA-binding transcriptional MerR regulator
MIRNRFTLIEVARQVGAKPWTLRRLEAAGRIPPARRDECANKSRVYLPEDVERIREAVADLGVTDEMQAL